MRIEVPEGFGLESANHPIVRPLGSVGHYRSMLGFDKEERRLQHNRYFLFGKDGKVFFPQEAYPTLKSVFDFIYTEDNKVITLKQTEAAAN